MLNIFHGSNREYFKQFSDESIHLVVTSPPYNIGKAYEKRIPIDQYLQDQSEVIAEAVRLLHPRGSLCWQVGNHISEGEVVPLDMLLYPLFKQHGLILRNRIIWHFGHGLHCKKRFSGRYETILWFTKTNDFTFNLDPVRVPSKYPGKKHFKGPKIGQLSGNPLGKNPSDVWLIPNVVSNHCEKTDHPCQFPVELIERLVLSMTNEGDSVLDPYMGSGSSLIAAIKHARLAYGCDIDEAYVAIANARVSQYKDGSLKTRPMDRPIFKPIAS